LEILYFIRYNNNALAIIKCPTGPFAREGKGLDDFIIYPIENPEVKSFGHFKDNQNIFRLDGQKDMPSGCRGVCPPACPLACRPAHLLGGRECQPSLWLKGSIIELITGIVY
ncbi:MAG: hypothetical protein N2201_06825, partial [candidate division WOR-3 bacterium]|nr:hypothetical protein [candidate division WOR-3 bacterium]